MLHRLCICKLYLRFTTSIPLKTPTLLSFHVSRYDATCFFLQYCNLKTCKYIRNDSFATLYKTYGIPWAFGIFWICCIVEKHRVRSAARRDLEPSWNLSRVYHLCRCTYIHISLCYDIADAIWKAAAKDAVPQAQSYLRT